MLGRILALASSPVEGGYLTQVHGTCPLSINFPKNPGESKSIALKNFFQKFFQKFVCQAWR
jgi:hypothetical protein